MTLKSVTEQSGVFGPIERLFYKADQCTPEDINTLTKMLKKTFFKLTNQKPDQRKICRDLIVSKIRAKEEIIPSEILKTVFFQEMRLPSVINLPPETHSLALKHIIPTMRKQAQTETPHASNSKPEEAAINDWCASFVECYMTPTQIKETSTLLQLPPAIQAERTRIGGEIIALIGDGKFTNQDFDNMLEALRDDQSKGEQTSGTDKEPPSDIVQEFVDKYNALFNKVTSQKTRREFKESVIGLLDTIFRKKYFSNEEKKQK